MADVNVPVIGTMPRGALVAGGLAVVGVGGYLLWKHVTKPATTTTPTGYGYGYGTTGYGYGSNVRYGYGYGYGAYSPYGTAGFGGGGGSPYYGYYGYTGSGGGPQPITTNAQWGQAAEAAMGSTGMDAIAAALAKYLFAGTLNEEQAQTVQEAIAVVGYPPVPGPGNYPPNMHVAKGPPPKSKRVTVPNVVGQETDAAVRTIEAKGLTASHPPLQSGVGSVVTAENPHAGASVKNGSNVALSIREKTRGRGGGSHFGNGSH